MRGLEIRRQFGSLAVAVSSAATRGPDGPGSAVLDVINPAAETLLRITMRRVEDIGLYLPHLGTGLANEPVASIRPVVLGRRQSRHCRAANDDDSKVMAGPRVRLAGSANWLRPPHVDWQQLHRPRMGQKISDVRRYSTLRDVGLFRRTDRCAAVWLAVRQKGPLFREITVAASPQPAAPAASASGLLRISGTTKGTLPFES